MERMSQNIISPLKAELNPICHLPTLLGAHRFFNISRVSVNLRDKLKISSSYNELRIAVFMQEKLVS